MQPFPIFFFFVSASSHHPFSFFLLSFLFLLYKSDHMLAFMEDCNLHISLSPEMNDLIKVFTKCMLGWEWRAPQESSGGWSQRFLVCFIFFLNFDFHPDHMITCVHVHRLSVNKPIGLNPELWQTCLRLVENALSHCLISKVQVNGLYMWCGIYLIYLTCLQFLISRIK